MKYRTIIGAALAVLVPALALGQATHSVGTANTTLGILKLYGSTSGDVSVKPAAIAGTSTVFQLPATNGSNTNVLQTDGSGVTSWVAAGSGDATLAGTQTFTGAKTFGETHGTTYAPTLTSNNYTATTADCGKTLLFPTGTTPTLTLPNLNAACTIVAVQNSAVQFTPQAASGGTLSANVNGFTKSKAQNAFLMFTITVPSGSAATWAWSGDGA